MGSLGRLLGVFRGWNTLLPDVFLPVADPVFGILHRDLNSVTLTVFQIVTWVIAEAVLTAQFFSGPSGVEVYSWRRQS